VRWGSSFNRYLVTGRRKGSMTFKILAIDGGGIRGIIPALMLAAIEDRTGRPTYLIENGAPIRELIG